MFIGIVRNERPDKYEEFAGPGDMISAVAGPLYISLTYILPLDYESWDLSSRATWLGRLLFVLTVASLIMVGLFLVSLITI